MCFTYNVTEQIQLNINDKLKNFFILQFIFCISTPASVLVVCQSIFVAHAANFATRLLSV